MLRSARLSVFDEIKNGLAYYHYTFLTEVPRLYAEIEDLLERRMGANAPEIPPFFASEAGSAAIGTAIPL